MLTLLPEVEIVRTRDKIFHLTKPHWEGSFTQVRKEEVYGLCLGSLDNWMTWRVYEQFCNVTSAVYVIELLKYKKGGFQQDKIAAGHS